MRLKTYLGWLQIRAKMVLAVAAVGGLGLLLLTLHLNNLMPGANHYELSAIDHLRQTVLPWKLAVDAPYFLLAALFKLVATPLMAVRLASVTLGLLTAGLLGYTIRQWFGDRVAVVGILLVITNSWFLHLARLGAPMITSSFFLAALLALGTWRTYTTKPTLVDILLMATVGLSLYEPYFMWLAIFGAAALLIKKNRRLIQDFHWKHWITPLLILVIASPLIIASFAKHDTLTALLGLSRLSNNGVVYTDHLITNIRQLFFRGEYDPSLNLGHLPFLDIFSNVMVGIGLYYYERRLNLRRGQIILGGLLALLTVISLSSFAITNLSILLPLIMLLTIGGVVELLNRWLAGFPRNPIARSVGVVMLVTAIGFTSFYHLQRYFVAWANYPDAVTAHRIQTGK